MQKKEKSPVQTINEDLIASVLKIRKAMNELQPAQDTLKTFKEVTYSYLCSDNAEDSMKRNEAIVMLRTFEDLFVNVEVSINIANNFQLI